MKFTLRIRNKDYPAVSVPIFEDPEDQTEMSLPRARQIALVMLEEYVKNNYLKGRAVRQARSEANALEPGHYVSLDGLQIELRQEGIILDA